MKYKKICQKKILNQQSEKMRSLIQKRWNKKAGNDEIASNAASIARKTKINKNLEEKIILIQKLTEKLEEYSPFVKKADEMKKEYPFLHYMFQTAYEKIQRKGKLIKGIRYHLFLIPYILILSLFAKKLASFLHIIIGIPTWGTIVLWKKKNISINIKFTLMVKMNLLIIYYQPICLI